MRDLEPDWLRPAVITVTGRRRDRGWHGNGLAHCFFWTTLGLRSSSSANLNACLGLGETFSKLARTSIREQGNKQSLGNRQPVTIPAPSGCWAVPALGALEDRIQPPNLSISKTVDEVIVHHADRLHVRIDDGRTNEAESPAFEILAKRVRFT